MRGPWRVRLLEYFFLSTSMFFLGMLAGLSFANEAANDFSLTVELTEPSQFLLVASMLCLSAFWLTRQYAEKRR